MHAIVAYLIVILLPFTQLPNPVVNHDVSKTYCAQATDYPNLDELKADLLTNVKKLAVNELFGELISASTEVEDLVVTGDKIRMTSLGLIRLDGSAKYFNGTSLAEVCVTIQAYVTEKDLAEFEPVQIGKRYCMTDPNLTTRQLTEAAKQNAILQALMDYDRRTELLEQDQALGLVQRVGFSDSGFVPDTETYCTRVEGFITPIAVKALVDTESPGGQSLTSSTNVSRGIWTDNFDRTTLRHEWSWINEDQSRWSLSSKPGYLQVIGANGDIYPEAHEVAPKNVLVQDAPTGDYEVETSLEIEPTANYQQGGLVVLSDFNNYLKLIVVHNGSLKVVFSFCRDGNEPDNLPYQALDHAGTVKLRIVKHGDNYTAYYSKNGFDWTQVGSWYAPRLSSARIGVISLAAGANPPPDDLTVNFDYVRISAK